jgi:sugar lactone lactonase YvrE
MTTTVEVALEHTCLLGEGPVWDATNKRILWVDILRGKIHQFFPIYKKHSVFKMDQMIGAIALRKYGGIVAALSNGFATIDIERSHVNMISDPEAHLANNRFNDGKCDPTGRFWAGTMDISEDADCGSLYTLEKDMSVSTKLKGVSCSNGLAWSNDHKTMFFIDTPTRQVAAFDYNAISGQINNKRIAISIPEEDGYPDGMTIDSEGMLWIALFDGWKVTRWDPNTGGLLLCIPLPVSKVTSCTFGGETLEDLYITSAKTGLNENEIKAQPLAGSLFVIKNAGFKGVGTYAFEG